MSTGTVVTYSFGHSTSKNYRPAVAIAEKLDGYEAVGRGSNVVHVMRMAPPEFRSTAMTQIVEMTRGFSTARIEVDGKAFTSVEVARCFLGRPLAGGRAYCASLEWNPVFSNPWGCRSLSFADLEQQHWKVGFGKIDPDKGIWRLNLPAISELAETEIERVMGCPAFSETNASETLRRHVQCLPQSIDPKTGWWAVLDENGSFQWRDGKWVCISAGRRKFRGFHGVQEIIWAGPSEPNVGKVDWERSPKVVPKPQSEATTTTPKTGCAILILVAFAIALALWGVL